MSGCAIMNAGAVVPGTPWQPPQAGVMIGATSE